MRRIRTRKSPLLRLRGGWGSYDYHRAWPLSFKPGGNPSRPPLNLRGGAWLKKQLADIEVNNLSHSHAPHGNASRMRRIPSIACPPFIDNCHATPHGEPEMPKQHTASHTPCRSKVFNEPESIPLKISPKALFSGLPSHSRYSQSILLSH